MLDVSLANCVDDNRGFIHIGCIHMKNVMTVMSYLHTQNSAN